MSLAVVLLHRELSSKASVHSHFLNTEDQGVFVGHMLQVIAKLPEIGGLYEQVITTHVHFPCKVELTVRIGHWNPCIPRLESIELYGFSISQLSLGLFSLSINVSLNDGVSTLTLWPWSTFWKLVIFALLFEFLKNKVLDLRGKL